MVAKKRILASDVYVGSSTVEARLLVLAEEAKADREQAKVDREQAKADRERNDRRFDEMLARIDQNHLETQDLIRALMLLADKTDKRFKALEDTARPAAE